MKQPLVILTGPTAVGKTALSIELARRIGGEILSADSMQVYKGMDIGSAKIMPEEMQGIPHYLIDELEPDEPFHVVKFQELAKKYMQMIWDKGKIPILTGGTGFYIQAVLYDIDFTENEEDGSYRQQLEKLAGEKGAEYLHDQLAQVDSRSAEQIHANNIKRVIRALEFYHETGTPISRHNEAERQKSSPYNFAYFVLNDDRETIYQRINLRVDRMLEAGLINEVEQLRSRGYTRDMVSMQGAGSNSNLDYLDGVISLEEAVYRIKRDTRHFAKRQITEFKREKDGREVRKGEFGYDEKCILSYLITCLEKKEILPKAE